MTKMKQTIVQRPWGRYSKIFHEAGVWVKRVEVDGGSRLSLQKHNHRSEKWIIVSGEGLVIIDHLTLPVFSGSVIDVPLGALHRMANTGKKPLVFIEVACGSKLTEDDIVRLHDDFDRIIGAGGTVTKKAPHHKYS
ncbi:MAG: phosphomannose isomerase type II C-terminal cupin domain [Candidatus Omnitrophota bacterium]